MKHKLLNLVAAFCLIILFLYSGIIKIIQHKKFIVELLQSPLFPDSFSLLLSYSIPTIEFGIIALLVLPATRSIGFYGSFFIMLLFTFYLIALSSFISSPPCACGGILGGMGYTTHIAFNIFFTLVALVGIYTHEEAQPAEPQTV